MTSSQQASAVTLPSERIIEFLPRRSPIYRIDLLLLELLLAAAIIGLSVLVHPWIEHVGETAYQEFLHFEWVVVAGDKGLQLDLRSLPLAPVLYIAAAALVGPGAADKWLPVALSVGILLVLTRVLLRGYPIPAKLLAAVPLLATPFFYVLQQHLNLQLYVLLLGLQLASLRAFRQRPTVARVTAAVGLNILLSLTTWAALIALAAAFGYLLVMTGRQGEVRAARWRALLWLYVPFSLSGYLIWALYWITAGSRLETSYFLLPGTMGPTPVGQLLATFSNDLALPLLLLLALALVMRIFARRPETRTRTRSQAIAWAVLAYMLAALGVLSLQMVFQAARVLPQALTFSLVLLVPAAVGSVYGQTRNVLHTTRALTRIVLVATMTTVMGLFALQYLLRPALGMEALLPLELRAPALRDAAIAYAKADPGGQVLLDPRFTASFVLAAGIEPRRLLTPFDAGFPRLVVAPPNNVRAIVVTDARDDLVGDNYPAMRLVPVLPDATMIAQGHAGPDSVRVFHREPFGLPTADVRRLRVEPYARAEEQLLAEVIRRLGPRLLPVRPDGWAYAVDEGNFLIYAAERGDAKLFGRVDAAVRRYYLITKLADRNALYTVAWRAQLGRPAEASGTTETLRVTEGYLDAAERWHQDGLARLAWALARSYVRHEQLAGRDNLWFIRNYYNYGTKQYATNTFTVDYYPSVLYRLSERTGDTELHRDANESRTFLHAAQLPSGLFYEMYQPEVHSIYPEVTYFSPNALVKVYDAAEVALGLVDNDPGAARRTLTFLRRQYPNLYSEYVTTNMEGHRWPARLSVYAGIARLATALGDISFARRDVNELLLPGIGAFVHARNDGSWFFDAITALLALRELQAAMAGTPHAPPPTAIDTAASLPAPLRHNILLTQLPKQRGTPAHTRRHGPPIRATVRGAASPAAAMTGRTTSPSTPSIRRFTLLLGHHGQAYELVWQTRNARHVMLDGRPVSAHGAMVLHAPLHSMVHRLAATNGARRATASLHIVVDATTSDRHAFVLRTPDIATFAIRHRQGQLYVIWVVRHAAHVQLQGRPVGSRGQRLVPPGASTLRLVAGNDVGSWPSVLHLAAPVATATPMARPTVTPTLSPAGAPTPLPTVTSTPRPTATPTLRPTKTRTRHLNMRFMVHRSSVPIPLPTPTSTARPTSTLTPGPTGTPTPVRIVISTTGPTFVPTVPPVAVVTSTPAAVTVT